MYSPEELCLQIDGQKGANFAVLFCAGSKMPVAVVKCNFRKNGLNVETESDAEHVVRPFASKLMGLMRDDPAGDIQVSAASGCEEA